MHPTIPRSFFSTCLIISFALTATAQAPSVPCEATPEVKQALRELPTMYRNRLVALKSLRERFPDDIFVHRSYQDVARVELRDNPQAVVDEYRALSEKRPNDPTFRHLATRALIGSNTPEAIKQLEAHLAESPAFPWTHMALVEIYRAPNFRDAEKYRRHVEAFLEKCPQYLDGYASARSVESPEFARRVADRLRAVLGDRTDPEAARARATLWALEFRATPAAEHDRLRKQVAEEVNRLRAVPEAATTREYLVALREGYTLTADAEKLKWAEEQLKIPASGEPDMRAMRAYEQWSEKNPRPKPDDPPGKQAAYQEAFLKASADWIREWPNEMAAWMQRMQAVRQADNVPAAEVIAAGENYLRLRDSTGWHLFAPSLVVAELYAMKKVALDRIPQLIERGLAEAEKQQPGSPQSDLYPRETAGRFDPALARTSNLFFAHMRAARLWLDLKNANKAREILLRAEPVLAKMKGSEAAERTYAFTRARHWENLGRLAELEDRRMDALTFYQNALLIRPPLPERAQPPPKDELAEKARALWKEFGGTNEGWQAWLNRSRESGPPAAASSTDPRALWTRMEKKLPAFELTDLRGRKWTLADFTGKTTFVNLWATW